ncbi:uncharacterized protein LOC131949979 [Physella acuta]|uniref:uncharacterized protein LOC131949979 n=1 Tax=Physella acuta TaxID=109671 RepID=UPI0027DB2ABF|nr:uncharacterized protein LOC131949979 [Physella acuta]
MGKRILLQLLACLLFLSDVQCKNNSFGAIILGQERDCINYYCRYTGRIYGYFWHPYKRLPPEVKFEPTVRIEPRCCKNGFIEQCQNVSDYSTACPLWTVDTEKESCDEAAIRFLCSCKKGIPYYFAFNPYYCVSQGRYFVRMFLATEGLDTLSTHYEALSNIFDVRNHPEKCEKRDRERQNAVTLKDKEAAMQLKAIDLNEKD